MTQLHKTEPIFVGRRDELKRFGEILASPKGQGVLVVGPQGMGKTLLANRMARMAQVHPDLACDHVRFEVTDTDEPDAVMELIIDRAFDAAGLEESSVGGGERRTRKYLALLKLLPRGDALGDLIQSLRRDPKKNARQQLGEKLECISRRMKKNARAIFVIDPEKYMSPRSAGAWRLVVDNLPDRIIFLFAQRPDDVLAKSAEFCALSNVVRIPDGPLDVLDKQAVDNLVQARSADLSQPIAEVRAALACYKGHPFAVAAALGLLADRAAISDLPADPTGVAGAQWRRLCDEHKEIAIRLFEAYAILEVAVPDEVVESVSGGDRVARTALVANAFVDGLLRREPDGKRIYQSLLADHIYGQISEPDARVYHTRAIGVYRRRLTGDVKPDALAAVRLPEHVLAVEGPEAFVKSFAGECIQPLLNLGLLDAALAMSHRAAQQYVAPGSAEDAAIKGGLGLIYGRRGELEKAENMHREALRIGIKLGRPDFMAAAYGNIGLIFRARSDLNEAEKLHRKALEIEKKLGQLKGMASQYGHLGSIFLTRGDLDEAEKMHRKSLEINDKLGWLVGMADGYCALGLVLQARDEIGGAEVLHRKSLEIEEKLGRLQGIARQYVNLGTTFQSGGDIDEAEKMFRMGLEIEKKLGGLDGMATAYGNLGGIYMARSDMDRAEKMLRKSLEIYEKLGRLEGKGNQYCNLGVLCHKRGDVDEARKHWTIARDLFAEIGMPHRVEWVQGLLDRLPDACEDRP